MLEQLNAVFVSLKCAAKLAVAFGFVLENIENEGSRYYYAHEIITLLERSKLVATTEDLAKLKNLLSSTDVIEWCTREQAITKWNVYKLTDVTFFSALLKELPIGSEDAVLPDPLMKNLSAKCLTFEENTRKLYNSTCYLFRALALLLHGNEGLEEETSDLFILFLKKTGGTSPGNLRGVCMEDTAAVAEIVQAYICFYGTGIVDGSMIGELAKRSVGKYSFTVRLLRYNSHICCL